MLVSTFILLTVAHHCLRAQTTISPVQKREHVISAVDHFYAI